MVKGSPYDNLNQVPDQEEMYGTILSENVIGVIHDHYITFYLDMDIDGSDNSFVKVDLARQDTSPGESPRRSYLKAKRQTAKTERDAQIKLKLYEPSEFHVINPSKKTRVGNPVGYKVVPAGTAANLLDPRDPPQLRGAFTNNQVNHMKLPILFFGLWRSPTGISPTGIGPSGLNIFRFINSGLEQALAIESGLPAGKWFGNGHDS